MAEKQNREELRLASLKNNVKDKIVPKITFSLHLKLALLLGFISLAIYANTLKNDFALDDYFVIKENTFVTKGIAAIPHILSTPYHWGYRQSSNDLYRPLSLVFFALLFQFFGDAPVVYHCLNIIVFAGCTLILFFLLSRLLDNKRTAIAFVASLLFALHPIHTEVVANCKSLDELLCVVFGFSSLYMFIMYAERGKVFHLLLGSSFLFLSFLAKETAVTFIIIIPLVIFFYKNDHNKRKVSITVAAIIISLVAVFIRFRVLSFYHADLPVVDFMDNPLASNDISFESRLATEILILGYYIKLLFIPYPLVCDYSYNSIPFTHFSDPVVLISLLVYIFLIVFSIKRLLTHRGDILALGILIFLITTALFSNIFFLIGDNMAERFMFFPSVGFCLVMGLIAGKFASKQSESDAMLKNRRLWSLVVPIAMIYAVITVQRDENWKDNYTLFKADISKAPNDSRLCFFLGNEVSNMAKQEQGVSQNEMLQQAVSYFNRAIEIYPGYSTAYIELGKTYYNTGNYNMAEMNAKKALQIEPGNIDAAISLGSVYLITHQYLPGIALYRDVIARSPDNVFAHYNLAACYANKGNYAPAIAEYKKTIDLKPDFENYKSLEFLTILYNMTGKTDSAILYQRMLQAYRTK